MATTSARGARQHEPDLFPGDAREQEDAYEPSSDYYGYQPRRSRRVDAWMDQEFKFGGSHIKRRALWLLILGSPAVVPLFFCVPALLTITSTGPGTIQQAIDDVLGTGAEWSLFISLLVSPMMTITGQRWFFPLRRWYGIMMAIDGIFDAIGAGIEDTFQGGFIDKLTEHTFVLVGTVMVLLLIPLLITGNNWAQRKMGRYWKSLHRLIYVVWGLLGVHLLLLFGFHPGAQVGGSGDGSTAFHLRFFQYASCSVFLLTLRLPPVKRWIAARQKEGRNWMVYAAVTPIFLLFLFGFIFIVNELVFKGVDMFNNTASNE